MITFGAFLTIISLLAFLLIPIIVIALKAIENKGAEILFIIKYGKLMSVHKITKCRITGTELIERLDRLPKLVTHYELTVDDGTIIRIDNYIRVKQFREIFKQNFLIPVTI